MPPRASTIGKFTLAAAGLVLVSCAMGAHVSAQSTPAATAAATAADGDADKRIAHGRELFANFSCGSCHMLADGEGEGHVGPALDGNPGLTEALVTDRVTNGQGPMPSFGGQLTKEEIADLAFYVNKVAKRQ